MCFRHPLNPKLCIKIAKKKEKQTAREIRYLSYAKKKKKDLTYISRFYHTVKTNLGPGYVFDLALGTDNEPAESLDALLSSNRINLSELAQHLSEFHHYLMTNALCVYDLSPRNVCVIIDHNHLKLFIIDGLGIPSGDFVTPRVTYLTRRLMHKRWRRFIRKIEFSATQ